MTGVYYNEIDKVCCAWLRELQGLSVISSGPVDCRDIHQVTDFDVAPHDICHFFAGIGGWDLALQLAEWPMDLPIWTASCPCQPYSIAGKLEEENDERNLWPVLRGLIYECQPPVVVGEQVASAAGRRWLAGVRSDLEALGYAVGASDLCAASVGAPHIRQRLYWVAYSNSPGRGEQRSDGLLDRERSSFGNHLDGRGAIDRVSDADGRDPEEERKQRGGEQRQQSKDGRPGGLGHSGGEGRQGDEHQVLRGSRRRQEGGTTSQPGATPRGLEFPESDGREPRRTEASERSPIGGRGGGFWSDYRLIHCRDGKTRRIESGTQPLAHGIPGRVGLLRGYGNAIVPPLAAEFLTVVKEIIGCR